jgi:hypothetical protein
MKTKISKLLLITAGLLAAQMPVQTLAQTPSPLQFAHQEFDFIVYNAYLPELGKFTALDTRTGLEWANTTDLAAAQALGFQVASQDQVTKAFNVGQNWNLVSHMVTPALLRTDSYGGNDTINFTSPKPNDVAYESDIDNRLGAAWVTSPTGNKLMLLKMQFYTYSKAPVSRLFSRIGDLDTLAAEIPQLKNPDGSAVPTHYFLVRDPSVPEASTTVLMALGLVGMGGLKAARRRRTAHLDA